ncbi:outer membrane protein assembly factor BamA, partial [Angulomicrobium tetraedrale]
MSSAYKFRIASIIYYVRLALIPLVVAFGAFAVHPASAGTVVQPAPSIVVEGNRRVDAETIRSYFQSKPGEPLTPAK